MAVAGEGVEPAVARHPAQILRLVFRAVLAEDQAAPRRGDDIVAIFESVGIFRFDEQLQAAGVRGFARPAFAGTRAIAPDLAEAAGPSHRAAQEEFRTPPAAGHRQALAAGEAQRAPGKAAL